EGGSGLARGPRRTPAGRKGSSPVARRGGGRVSEGEEHSFAAAALPQLRVRGGRRRGKNAGKECWDAAGGGMRPAAWSVRASRKKAWWGLTTKLLDGPPPQGPQRRHSAATES